MKPFSSWRRLVALASICGLAALAHAQQTPIRVGGTLALTGPLSATGLVHKLTGEIYVEELNKRGGLLGRPVEWVLKDDQSKPDLARTLYEQLVTADKVDLLIGPYATGGILSAMGVAQRYNKMLVHHTFGIPNLAKYDSSFRPGRSGPTRRRRCPNTVLDALAARGKPPKTIAVVTSKFPSVHFMSLGAREVAKQRGLKEVLFLEWDFGNRDFGPIAGRIKEANPDFIWIGAIGLEGNQLLDAMKKIDYAPLLHFYIYPAPAPMLKAPEANGALATTHLRGPSAVHQQPGPPPSSSRSSASAPPRPACPTPRSRRRPPRRTLHGRSSRPRWPRPRAWTTRPWRPGCRRTRSTPSRASCASTARQLRRRPEAGEAGAERQVGHRLADRVGRARRQADPRTARADAPGDARPR